MRHSHRVRSWRTIRQRRRRAFAGQVSAVATILGLLLVVSFIAQFTLVQLPNQMAQNEFDHMLLVENQLGRLQSTVLLQALESEVPMSVISPVTLGSSAEPPFAPASDGWITPEVPGTEVSVLSSTANIGSVLPNWTATPGCASGSTCSGPIYWDNYSNAVGATLNWTFSAATPSFLLNLSGNNDTLTVTFSGTSIGYVLIYLSGSHLHLSLVKTSTGGSGTAPRIFVLAYGRNDVVTTGLKGANIVMSTKFYGSGQLCPNGNQSNTDRFYWNATGDTSSSSNVTWFNSLGYVSYHSISLGSSSFLNFRNSSAFPAGCAWSLVYTTNYATPVLSGLRVHMDNRYIPTADLVYDAGAVLVSHPGIGSIMLDPPAMSITSVVGGYDANFTIVNTLMNTSVVAGTQTTGVTSQVVSVQHYNIVSNPASNQYFIGVWLNVTTPYPNGWNTFLNSFPNLASPGSTACTAPGTIAAPYTCLAPPSGMSVTLSLPLLLLSLSLTVVTVQLVPA